MKIYKRPDLLRNYFTIESGTLLIRHGLFNQALNPEGTKIWIIDPTQTATAGGPFSEAELDSKFGVTAISHLSIAKEKVIESAWTTASWEVAELTDQVIFWMVKNFDRQIVNVDDCSMNLIMAHPIIEGDQYHIAFIYYGNHGDEQANNLVYTNEADVVSDNDLEPLTI